MCLHFEALLLESEVSARTWNRTKDLVVISDALYH